MRRYRGQRWPYLSEREQASAKVEDAAQSVHRTTDKIAEKGTAQVDRLSGTPHRAVSSVSDAASSAAKWASAIPDRVKQMPARLTEASALRYALVRLLLPSVRSLSAIFLGASGGREYRLRESPTGGRAPALWYSASKLRAPPAHRDDLAVLSDARVPEFRSKSVAPLNATHQQKDNQDHYDQAC